MATTGRTIGWSGAMLVALNAWPQLTMAQSVSPMDPAAQQDGWILGSDDYRVADYARQPYIGNGRLGAMLPATGEGYQGDLGPTGWPLYTQRYTGSLLAGYYARSGRTEHIAALPTWSTLILDVDGHHWEPGVPPEQVTGWRQQLDLRHALVSTSATWTPVPGKATTLRYDVFIDRANQHVAVVQLSVMPHWSGQLAITGLLDGHGARRVTAGPTSYDAGADMVAVTVHAEQTGKTASEVGVLDGSANVHVGSRSAAGERQAMTAGERWMFPVVAGETYRITKYVGIASADDGADPLAVAKAAALQARRLGWDALLREHERAWAQLWTSDIEVTGNPVMQRRVRASLYSLYASVRAGQAWSIAASGLSSDNYAGMIFWDDETWMYPALLALHPELARPVLDLRYDTLAQARRNALEVHREGAVWPWSTGPSMLCGDDGPCSDYQDHLQSEIGLAQWQYYLATGDRQWLRERGWPVLHDIAAFWQGRARRDADGRYHIDDVAGSDEYAVHVNDHAMTNVGASQMLRIATLAAPVAGAQADPAWQAIADRLVVPMDARHGVHAEYAGYDGRKIKQADVVLMSYPYEYPMPRAVAQADLDYYAARTDPDGPAMTDSVQAIVALQIGLPGCMAWHYLQRAVDPFVRAPFEQFSEARGDKAGDNAGAPSYVFETGAGGFLQIFLYGLSGQRWRSDRVVFEPTLLPQVGTQVTIRGLRYQGRTLDLVLGLQRSSITLIHGVALQVETDKGLVTLQPGATHVVDTARPDLSPTPHPMRCVPNGTTTPHPAKDP